MYGVREVNLKEKLIDRYIPRKGVKKKEVCVWGGGGGGGRDRQTDRQRKCVCVCV